MEQSNTRLKACLILNGANDKDLTKLKFAFRQFINFLPKYTLPPKVIKPL